MARLCDQPKMTLDYSRLPYRIEPMTPQDIEAVMNIELVSFSAPWSARAYDYEVRYNEMAHYYVARLQKEMPPVNAGTSLLRRWFRRPPAQENTLLMMVGYGGFWLMVDEAHISTLATHPLWRRRGVGELLLLAMIEHATEIGARWITLEVRPSNIGAQALYRKYGFEVTGLRKRYYSDNGEDALIMATPIVTTADYQRKLQELKDALFHRLAQ